MATLGDLVVNLTGNATGLVSTLARSSSSLASFSSRALGSVGSVSRSISGLGSTASVFTSFVSTIVSGLGKLSFAAMGVITIWHGLVGLSMPLQLAAGAETNQAAFTVMLQSATKAKQTLADLAQFAASTPYGSTEITAAARKLLAFGVAANDLIPTLSAVGDISSSIGAPIGEIAELYGKAKVQGRLFQEDINQLTGRGIPIIQELAKIFKKPESAIRDLVEKGQVNFGHLQTAFANLTAAGGTMGGQMDAQSKTTAGLWSTLKDNVELAMLDIGSAIIEGFNLKGALNSLIAFTGEFRSTWLPKITDSFRATIAQVTALWVTWGPVVQAVFAAWYAYVSTVLQGVVAIGSGAFTVLTGLISSLLGVSADDAGGCFAKIGAMWTTLTTDGQTVFWEWIDSISIGFQAAVQVGTALFSMLGTAISTTIQWLSSFVTGSMGTTWSEISSTLAFAVRNWDTLFLIAAEKVKLFASNAWAEMQAFFENLKRWLAWLPDNWSKVLKTMASFLAAAFVNMAVNVSDFFKSMFDWAKGKGFKFEATNLMDGFENAIDTMPDLVSAAVANSTPELDQLYKEMGQKEAEFQRQQANRAKQNLPPVAPPAIAQPDPKQKSLADIIGKKGPEDTKKVSKKDRPELKALEANSAEAFRTILAGTRNGPPSDQKKMVKGIDTLVDLQKEANRNALTKDKATQMYKPKVANIT